MVEKTADIFKRIGCPRSIELLPIFVLIPTRHGPGEQSVRWLLTIPCRRGPVGFAVDTMVVYENRSAEHLSSSSPSAQSRSSNHGMIIEGSRIVVLRAC